MLVYRPRVTFLPAHRDTEDYFDAVRGRMYWWDFEETMRRSRAGRSVPIGLLWKRRQTGKESNPTVILLVQAIRMIASARGEIKDVPACDFVSRPVMLAS
jgi:hypothetical protein